MIQVQNKSIRIESYIQSESQGFPVVQMNCTINPSRSQEGIDLTTQIIDQDVYKANRKAIKVEMRKFQDHMDELYDYIAAWDPNKEITE